MSIKVFLAGALIGLVVISAAWGQNAAPGNPSGQVVPGTTASIGPAQGVNGAPGNGAPVDAPHKVLNSALTPQTRQTLQEAMNSFGDGTAPGGNPGATGEVVLGPGEAAQLNGGTVGRIGYDTLPNQVKSALGAPVHDTLNSSQGR